MKQPVKIVLGVTAAGSSRLLDGQLLDLKQRGYDVYMMSPDHPKEHIFVRKEQCTHLPINVKQDISLVSDVLSLWRIIKTLRRVKPDIINFGTPKISLLGMLAGKMLGVKVRIYSCWGLRFETEKGIKRQILKFMELLTVMLASKVVYVSESLLRNSLAYGTARSSKSLLIEKGSSNGVDVQFFNRESINVADSKRLAEQHALEGKFVIGFVGRVTRDKGVFELVDAFETLQQRHAHIKLVMMGHVKCPPDFKKRYESNPGIIHIPFQDNVPLYMSLFDLLVLPSWREGFPNVPIQAAAMGIPVIVSDSTGCVDSVKHGFNGLVFKTKDEAGLRAALEQYIVNNNLKQQHGSNGIEWAKNFSQKKIWEGLDNLYRSMLLNK